MGKVKNLINMLPSKFQCLVCDRRASIAVIFALSISLFLVPLVGIAIDYSGAYKMRSYITDISDAAMLAGTKKFFSEMDGGASETAARQAAVTYATHFVSAKINLNDNKYNLSENDFQFTFQVNNQDLEGSVNFNKPYDTIFGGVLNVNTIPIQVQSDAVVSLMQEIDILFLVDISASMGVAATVAEIATLHAATECGFACHYPPENDPWNFTDQGIDDAQRVGVRLRIDIVRDAIETSIKELQQRSAFLDFKVAIHGFSQDVVQILELTNDANTALNGVNGVQLSYLAGGGGTNFNNIFMDYENIIENYNNTEPNREKYVVVISDGLQIYEVRMPTTSPYGRLVGTSAALPNFQSYGSHGTFNPDWCTKIKDINGNIQLYTLMVDPINPWTRTQYPDIAQKRLSMRDCASSPAQAKTANEADEIKEVFQNIINDIISQLRVAS